jgi:hypothetical protein
MMDNLPEVNYNQNQGFQTALFINLNRYEPNFATPKKEHQDNFDRLSIESGTPFSTPKKEDDNKKESQFKYCIPRDLLKRLEEESPLKLPRMGNLELNSDLYSFEDDVELFSNEKETDSSYELFKFVSKPIINTCSTNNASSDSESALTPQKNNSFTDNTDTTVSKRNSEEKRSVSDEKELKELNFNNSEDVSPKYQYMVNNGFYPMSFMMYNNMNGVNINGKNGWICIVCSNFNYESIISF